MTSHSVRDKYAAPLIGLTAGLTLLTGLCSAIVPLSVRLSGHPRLFSVLVPGEAYHFNKSLTVILGYLLIFLGLNLFKRARRAWWLTVILCTLNVIALSAVLGQEHVNLLLIKDRDLGELLPLYAMAPSLITLATLCINRRYFTRRSASSSIFDALRIIAVSGAVMIAYGVLGFFWLDKRDLGVDFHLQSAFTSTVQELTAFGTSGPAHAHTYFGKWFLHSLRTFGTVCVLGIIYAAFMPIRYRLWERPSEKAQAQRILETAGETPLDIFKIANDKSLFFGKSQNGLTEGFVAYGVANDIAVALGEAVCLPEQKRELIGQYCDFCHENGWHVAFLQVNEQHLAAYEANGLNALQVGEDAIVDLEVFCRDTIKKKTFKSTIKKFEKDGYRLVKHAPPHSEALLDEVQRISDAWLRLPGRRERGFSLGQFDRQDLGQDNLYVLRDKDGKGVAFVNQIRSYRRDRRESTIDMMRYGADAPNGTMDFLFVELMKSLKADGYEEFSLGLAALSGVGQDSDDDLKEKALHQIYEHLNRFFSYKGLRNYKNKFEPRWEPRYLIYEGRLPNLIKTGLAIAKITEKTQSNADDASTASMEKMQDAHQDLDGDKDDDEDL